MSVGWSFHTLGERYSIAVHARGAVLDRCTHLENVTQSLYYIKGLSHLGDQHQRSRNAQNNLPNVGER